MLSLIVIHDHNSCKCKCRTLDITSFNYSLVSVKMDSGSFSILLMIGMSSFCAVNCTCGVTYLRHCQQSISTPSASHISLTDTVTHQAECVDLCNSNKTECLAFDTRLLNDGSYNCQLFKNLGRSNCADVPETQYYVRVRN